MWAIIAQTEKQKKSKRKKKKKKKKKKKTHTQKKIKKIGLSVGVLYLVSVHGSNLPFAVVEYTLSDADPGWFLKGSIWLKYRTYR